MNDENNFEQMEKRKKLKILLSVCAAGILIIIVLFLLYKNCIIVSHKWIDATCEHPKTCERCGATEGNTLPHTVSEWVIDKEPTCTAEGEKHYVCSVCGKSISQKIESKGHNLGEWVTEKEPTCTDKGEKVQTCTVCGKKNTESIPAAEHNFVDDEITTYATLYTQGQKQQKCTKCGSTIDVAYNLSDAEKANINLVINGTFDNYPNKTIGEAFNSYFADPVWSADGNFVAFNGSCTWWGAPTKATIGFNISGNRFELGAINIGGETYDNIYVLIGIIADIYEGN